MDRNSLSFQPENALLGAAMTELSTCNEISAAYGLVLTETQMRELVHCRFQALHDNGRIEFGGGILPKLVAAFCDSPFVQQEGYEALLCELQDAFYYYKNESRDHFSDDELIGYMKTVFNGRAQGSVEYLTGTSLESLCRCAGESWDPRDGERLGDLF